MDLVEFSSSKKNSADELSALFCFDLIKWQAGLPGRPVRRPASRLRDQLPQHIREDAAVLVVFDLDRGIDAAGDPDVFF